MNAPDKIYIHTRTEPYCSITWSEVPEKNCTNEEYIRKDAVLELLQNRNKEINGTSKALFRSQELQEIYRRINEL